MFYRFKKTKKGQISIEASIIVPIVIIVVASLIYMAFYAHDLVSVRSGAYSWTIEEENRGKIPSLFVIRPEMVKTDTVNNTKVTMQLKHKGNINFINRIIQRKTEESLSIQKTMNTEILYASKAFLDMKKEGGYLWK